MRTGTPQEFQSVEKANLSTEKYASFWERIEELDIIERGIPKWEIVGESE